MKFGVVLPGGMYPDLLRDRRTAKEAGARMYFPGLYCRRGSGPHLGPRRVSDAKCCACLDNERQKKEAAAAKLRAKLRARLEAPKIAVREAKAKAVEAAREAKRAQQRAEREERAKARTRMKAAATRAANKAAREAEAAQATRAGAFAFAHGAVSDDAAPWDC